MISNKKVVEAAKTIVDYCKQQGGKEAAVEAWNRRADNG